MLTVFLYLIIFIIQSYASFILIFYLQIKEEFKEIQSNTKPLLNE